MIYPIPPGYFCVPSAIMALTGADPVSVVIPALNRADQAPFLFGPVSGVTMNQAERVLRELGYTPRPYRHKDLRTRLSTWAARSLRYPGRPLLVATAHHALVIEDGQIYDNHTPFGAPPETHPYRGTLVTYCVLVEPRR